jgi:hypothetical protein
MGPQRLRCRRCSRISGGGRIVLIGDDAWRVQMTGSGGWPKSIQDRRAAFMKIEWEFVGYARLLVEEFGFRNT